VDLRDSLDDVEKRKSLTLGRAVAQAVSPWLPTAAARVLVRGACGICDGQSGTEVGFLRVFRFPLPIIPPISLSSKSPEAGGRSAEWTQLDSTPHPTIPIQKIIKN
jgi:hypothetical protein